MNKQTVLYQVFHFFLIKIIIGIAIIVGLVFITEWCGKFLDQIPLTDYTKNIIIAMADSGIALTGYIFLFKNYEKRRITELSFSTFTKNAMLGVATGFVLQSLFIVIIFAYGGYSILRVNPVSFLILPFVAALKAGFVAEIVIVGVFFRITEEKLGTIIALAIITILFAILHMNSEGASFVSVSATAAQAGLMLSAAYVFKRNLWFPIFLHFGWDFTEPGIYGAPNPGNSVPQHLLTSKLNGPALITGGVTGPQNSVQALILCLLTASLLLWFAKRNNNFIQPCWKNKGIKGSER